MSEQSATPESGALSFDEAVASLTAPEPEAQDEAPESADEAAPEPEEPEAETSPSDDAGEAEEPGDSDPEEPEAEAEADPLNAPQRWTKEEKDHFAALDRKTQEILLAQETKREAVTEKAKQQASEAAKVSQQEAQHIQTLAGALNEFLPNAVNAFKAKWAGVEQPGYWKAVRDQYGVDAERDLRDAHEYESNLLRQTAAAKQEADRLARETRIKDTESKLPELAPALADPRDGKARWQRTKDFLVGLGADSGEVELMGPVERGLAYDAMLHRQAKSVAGQQPKPKQAAKQAPRAVARPAAAQPGTSQQRSDKALSERFSETRSFEDAVALLAAKG